MSKKVFVLFVFSFGILCIAIGCCVYSLNFLIGTSKIINSQLVDMYATVTSTQLPQEDESASEQILVNIINAEVDTAAEHNLSRILSVDVPENDMYVLAAEFRGIQVSSKSRMSEPVLYRIGDIKEFTVLNIDTNVYQTIKAKLHCITTHVYFWAEEKLSTDDDLIQTICDEFENKIYPTNREFFGSEWTPGVDNDVRIYILYAKNLGGAAGYFSSSDTLLKEIEPFSNEKEMFYLSADYLDLKEKYTLSTLAHEFQHMIHWSKDRNESSWVNEGFSELASYLNGYDPGGYDYVFTMNPDINLTFWPGSDQGYSGPHYGASYLFMSYLLNRFGETTTRRLVEEPANGMEGLEFVLQKHAMGSGMEMETPESVFIDWTIANLINNSSINDGRYAYNPEQSVPLVYPNQSIKCDESVNSFTVNQFGTDYYRVENESGLMIRLNSEATVPLIAVSPHSGSYHYWSNRGDESHMRLWRNFDFREVTKPINMTFWVWYDIEKDYDYAYITAQVGNQQKEILEIPSCTKDNPSGANYGCGLNGKSNEWVLQTVDLSKYAGKEVRIAFEYITDSAVNGNGMLIDDIEIQAVNYSSDFEVDGGGWQNEGFVRVSENVPQRIAVSLVQKEQGIYDVKTFMNFINGEMELFIPPKSKGTEIVLLVSALNRVSFELSTYTIQCIPH